MRNVSPFVALGPLVVAVALAAPSARADAAIAEALFVEARRLAAEGRYAEACPKFEESYREDPGIGAAFNLADCWEHVGRTASAWAGFHDVAARARLAGQGPREQAALERASRLEPALCKLKVDVASRAPGLVVTRDGHPVGAGQLGVPVPVDPGFHAIDATAPGRLALHRAVELGPCPSVAALAIPELEVEPASREPAARVPAAVGSTQRTIGWSLLGGAGALGVLGAVALVARQGELDGYNKDPTCPGLGAPQPGGCAERVDREKTWTTVSAAAFAGAGAFGLASIVLLLTAPRGVTVSCAHGKNGRVGLRG